MSRPVLRDTIYKQQDKTDARVDKLERFSALQNTIDFDIDTTGLTSAQIDAQFEDVPRNGTLIMDSVNRLLLVRMNDKWCESAALTEIL